MVVKEFKEKNYENAMRKAGHAAEKQMAFYLGRELRLAENIFVLNDVKVSVGGDNAQIDHLIVHPAGVVIVESKSVGGELTINANGDWIRKTGSKKEGMPSPIIQATHQSEVLKRYLTKQGALLGWNFPKSFKYDVFVAVSDKGIINREFDGELDELCKADQLAGKAKELISDRLKSSKINRSRFEFAKEVAFNLVEPKNGKKVQSKVKEPKATYKANPDGVPPIQCSKCDSSDVQVAYGRYGYYFKCSACDGNTKLTKWLKCVAPECKPKISKSKTDFFKVCEKCQSKDLFFQNKA